MFYILWLIIIRNKFIRIFNVVRDGSAVIIEYYEGLTVRKITIFRSVRFIAQQVNTWFDFTTWLHNLCLTRYSFPYPQFLWCSDHRIAANMEWGRKTIERALVEYRNGYLVHVQRLGTVEYTYILCSLVQLRKYMHKLERSFILGKFFIA